MPPFSRHFTGRLLRENTATSTQCWSCGTGASSSRSPTPTTTFAFSKEKAKAGPITTTTPTGIPTTARRKGPFHTMQSVSKSVTSTLIGIAKQNGARLDLDSAVLPHFEGFRAQKDDPRWRAITLRHLLTMTSGIEWDETTVTYTDPKNSCAAMEGSENWVQFVLDQKMAAEPGKVFVYNSGVTELLGQILKNATGKDPDAYAGEQLFGPLGIEGWYWKKTPSGLSDTEGGLYLSARDLAKIGYLYSKDGVWEGKRILPKGCRAIIHRGIPLPLPLRRRRRYEA